LNTRKVLMTLAETEKRAELVLVMLPKGEHKQPAHLARHPFGKVPVLDDGDVRLIETRAINGYVARKAGGALLGRSDLERAMVDQWVNMADSYFVPHVHPLIVETLFRRYLGGEQDRTAIATCREGMQVALDVVDGRLAKTPFLAGETLTIADIHWLPYLEYLSQIGESDHVKRRRHLAGWFERVTSRESWRQIARTGPQPWEEGMTAEVIERQDR
jgi:glutathione S-transferase